MIRLHVCAKTCFKMFQKRNPNCTSKFLIFAIFKSNVALFFRSEFFSFNLFIVKSSAKNLQSYLILSFVLILR